MTKSQKTKLILHVISQLFIILLSQFCSLYAKRSILCAVFPNVPVVIAMTATPTAYKPDQKHIKESLGLHNCFEFVANSDRKNIFYEKAFRYRQDIDALEDICGPIYAVVCAKHNVYVLSVV